MLCVHDRTKSASFELFRGAKHIQNKKLIALSSLTRKSFGIAPCSNIHDRAKPQVRNKEIGKLLSEIGGSRGWRSRSTAHSTHHQKSWSSCMQMYRHYCKRNWKKESEKSIIKSWAGQHRSTASFRGANHLSDGLTTPQARLKTGLRCKQCAEISHRIRFMGTRSIAQILSQVFASPHSFMPRLGPGKNSGSSRYYIRSQILLSLYQFSRKESQ